MADIVALIEKDHRDLEDVFVSLEAADSDPRPLLEQVAQMLIPHSKAEEQVVYPAIRQIVPDEGEDVDDSLAEHHHVEKLLERALSEGTDAPGNDGLVAAIIGEVRHHVEEEEQEILPSLARHASAAQLDDIGSKFLSAKKTSLAQLKKAGI